jgi:hypothetical protein
VHPSGEEDDFLLNDDDYEEDDELSTDVSDVEWNEEEDGMSEDGNSSGSKLLGGKEMEDAEEGKEVDYSRTTPMASANGRFQVLVPNLERKMHH